MPAVHRVGGCLLVARGWQRKDSLNIGPELRLIVFDDHDIIAAFVHNGLRHVALRQERVHRDNTAFQDSLAQERLDSRDLIGFVVNRVLGQRNPHVVRQRR